MKDVHLAAAAIVAGYIVALFVVTWWAQRSPSARGGVVGYLLAGRQLPPAVVAALLAGLAVGGASTIGVAEQAYKVGISAGWYNTAWAIGALVAGLLVVKRYRRLEVTTIPELFERHYGAGARLLGVVGQLAIHVVITALQYVAGGAILSSLLPGVISFQQGMIATAVVFVGITLIGGFWAAGLTNVVNVVVIYVGIGLGVVLTLARLGGPGALADALPAGHPGYAPGAVGGPVIAAWILVMVTTVLSTQSVVQISFAARDERAARSGFLWGALLILPVGIAAALLGMGAAVLHPTIVPAEALPRTVLELPPAVAGVVLSGLWAADVSTASALLIGSATLVSGDVVKRFVAPGLSPDAERLVARVSVAVLGVITFALALEVQGILKMLLAGLTLCTAYTLILLATIFLPSLCRRSSATWTLLATMGSLTYWLVAKPRWSFLPHPIFLTWATSLLAFLVVAAVDRRRITASTTTELPAATPVRRHGT